MLETRAIVIHVQGSDALVEAKGGGGCGNCDSENGCGSGKLSKLFCTKPRQFTVRNEANAVAGDEVQITLPDGVLLRSSMLMYVLPLSLLMSGGMVGAHWANDVATKDAYAALGSLLGLVAGFALARWTAKRQMVKAVARSIG
ncbi:MAG: SoxR reducing system RseC family protein [Gallionellaceae bacterium]|nr:SoxR reducing system RseC family protein [Gallionellaceae bacterium]